MVDAIEGANDWIYPNINNGVYRCGFAKSQIAYDAAITDLTDAFDKVTTILEQQRFIAGDRLTLADIRLFVTLIRFDPVYIVYFKTNTRSVTSPAFSTTVATSIKFRVWRIQSIWSKSGPLLSSHPQLNAMSIIPEELILSIV
jgi:putative glutathione S-transferase